jgi:DNA-binding GntR family transcriptional regulator
MTMPLDVQPIADRVYTELRARILDGDLEHGQRLHQEAVSAALGVSRTPVREALGRLAAEGLVQLLPQRGARVAPVRPEDIRSAYEARLVIEPGAAALAARRPAAERGLDDMRAAIEAMRGAEEVRAAFLANRDFHLAVVRASGNDHLLRFAEMLWVRRLGLTIYSEQRRLPAFLELDADAHAAIADAIAAGEPNHAERLTWEHIGHAMALLLDRIPAGRAP